jgi:hypothetical protein
MLPNQPSAYMPWRKTESSRIASHRFNVDRIDRLFYALLPVVGYLVGLIAAVLLVTQATASANLIAAAVLTLLFAAIRNVWDMMVWIVIKTPSGGMPPPSNNYVQT